MILNLNYLNINIFDKNENIIKIFKIKISKINKLIEIIKIIFKVIEYIKKNNYSKHFCCKYIFIK